MRYKAPRGTQDILPGQVERWQEFERAAHQILSNYGYREIRTPVFEQKELFLRAVGQETDIVQKEMYCFEDRKQRQYALRPEGTAPVIRAYVEHALWKDRPFQKLYYIGPMFRYDRPQKGRYRQFHQVGAEAVGSLEPLVDAELIAMVGKLLEAAGVKRVVLKLNSLGEAESRGKYAVALKNYFSGKTELLCPDCRVRLEANPLRILDCKVPGCHELSRKIPPMEDYLSPESLRHYESVQRWLGVLGVAYEKDKNLVRGLDYYTRTAFEFHHGELGASVALGGGGRYDSLVAECEGPDTPAIGFSLGSERVLLAASQDSGLEEDSGRVVKNNSLYLAWLGQAACEKALGLAMALRGFIRVEMDLEPRSLKAQLRQANKLETSHTVILAGDELAADQARLKEMSSGRQEEIKLGDLLDYVKNNIKSD